MLDVGFEICICMFALVNFACVNPFAPKLDTQPALASCSDLTSIENVLCTFRNAYTFKDTTLYSSVIGNDFTFIFRDYDRGVDVSWGRNDEMRTTYALFQSAQSVTLIWNNILSSNITDTVHSIIRGFNLTIMFNANDVTHVDGYANLILTRPTTNDPWKIVRWRDESNY